MKINCMSKHSGTRISSTLFFFFSKNMSWTTLMNWNSLSSLNYNGKCIINYRANEWSSHKRIWPDNLWRLREREWNRVFWIISPCRNGKVIVVFLFLPIWNSGYVQSSKSCVHNPETRLTICPCFALFFISTISFFSCDWRPCLSLSISLIDLSSILLFSRRSSENHKRIFVSFIHKTYGICIAKCAQAMSTNYKTGYVNMLTLSLYYLIKRVQQLFLN